jgi:hypothetical protein
VSETKSIPVTTRSDAFIACRKLDTDSGSIDAGRFLLGLFGATTTAELPDRQLGEFVRLCELGPFSTTLDEFKQLIRVDAGPPERTYEDVVDAATALQKRINEDAVRFLCRRFGVEHPSSFRHHNSSNSFRKFIRLSRLEAKTAEAFAQALADADLDHYSRELRTPLPDDLQVLALDYWCNRDLLTDDTEALYVLHQIGRFSIHKPNEITIFGKGKTEGVRLDVIARRSDLDKHTRGSPTPIRVFERVWV